MDIMFHYFVISPIFLFVTKFNFFQQYTIFYRYLQHHATKKKLRNTTFPQNTTKNNSTYFLYALSFFSYTIYENTCVHSEISAISFSEI